MSRIAIHTKRIPTTSTTHHNVLVFASGDDIIVSTPNDIVVTVSCSDCIISTNVSGDGNNNLWVVVIGGVVIEVQLGRVSKLSKAKPGGIRTG